MNPGYVRYLRKYLTRWDTLEAGVEADFNEENWKLTTAVLEVAWDCMILDLDLYAGTLWWVRPVLSL